MVQYLAGWQEDISACRTWEALPQAAKVYITTLEAMLDHEIQFISVGATRDAFLTKGAWE